MNGILIYLSKVFIDWSYTTNALFGWLGQLLGDPYNAGVMVFCYTGVQWALPYVLYKQQGYIFYICLKIKILPLPVSRDVVLSYNILDNCLVLC